MATKKKDTRWLVGLAVAVAVLLGTNFISVGYVSHSVRTVGQLRTELARAEEDHRRAAAELDRVRQVNRELTDGLTALNGRTDEALATVRTVREEVVILEDYIRGVARLLDSDSYSSDSDE